MYRLIHTNLRPFVLSEGADVLVGRGEQCDLVLNDPTVSRAHCRMCVEGQTLTVTDLESRWGTYVNGQQVSRHELKGGDRLRIGETTLVVECDPDGNETLKPTGTPDGIRIQNTLGPETPPNAQRRSYVVDEKFNVPQLIAPFNKETFVGREFASYQVDSCIAQTANSLVFRAKEPRTEQFVALRLFNPGTFEDARSEERFRRAAAAVRELRHPNIVRLIDAGRTQGVCYTASQFINGESAVDLIRRTGIVGMLDSSVVLQIACDLCDGLQCIESHEILHRNIKPSNILIEKRAGRSVALLNDLVLAKALTESSRDRLTQAGEAIGDISYMSPEQLGSGYPVDCRSDLYQLGVTLYALLTGRELFSEGAVSERIRAALTEVPDSIQSTHLATPPQFDSLILKLLRKNPSERFQNARELSVALQRVAAELGQQAVRPVHKDPNDEGWGGGLDGML